MEGFWEGSRCFNLGVDWASAEIEGGMVIGVFDGVWDSGSVVVRGVEEGD